MVDQEGFTSYKLTQESIEADNIETLNRDITNSQEKEAKSGVISLKSNTEDSYDTGDAIKTSSSIP